VSISRSLRLAVVLGLATLYLAVYVGSGRAQQRKAGLDPMAPDVRAVERALRDGRLDQSTGAAQTGQDDAISLATSLTAAHPGEPFPTFLLATALQRRGHWAAAAAAWARYVRQSTTAESACPQIAVAYERAGDPEKAGAIYRAHRRRAGEELLKIIVRHQLRHL